MPSANSSAKAIAPPRSSALHRVLTGTVEPGEQATATPLQAILAVLFVGGALYGVVMGSYGGRPSQALFAAIKTPLLLVGATLICLPNFYVVNAVLGLRADFGAACRAVLATEAVVAAMLAALAPVTALVYVSGVSYSGAVFLNGCQFLFAALIGQLALRTRYAELVLRDRRHVIARRVWTLLFVFVAIQLSWVLRPYVGAPSMPSQFFRAESWSNAYVVVAELVCDVLGPR